MNQYNTLMEMIALSRMQLATVVPYFKQKWGPVLVYGRAILIDPDGKPIHIGKLKPYDPYQLLLQGNFVSQPSALFRKDAFDTVGGLDKDLKYCMDYDLWLKLSIVAFSASPNLKDLFGTVEIPPATCESGEEIWRASLLQER